MHGQSPPLTNLIVITGGPGAGKTAVLEMFKKMLEPNSVILPESASILFGGGFWRLPSITAKIAAQRAIFHVQTQLENLVLEEKVWQLGLCDRGTLDGLAYWPKDEKSFFEMTNTTMKNEFEKYYAVIHLRSPSDLHGYNHSNPLRTETAIQSQAIDERIAKIWNMHPRYVEVKSCENFLDKAQLTIDLIKNFSKEL